MLFANIEPLYEAMFYVGAIGFLMIYLHVLIKDVHNPFDHYTQGAESAHISLKPMADIETELRAYTDELRSVTGAGTG